jgi:plasmid stabilization system protein ParE
MRPVVWSEDALRDYFDILRYIGEDHPLAAERVVESIAKAADDLGKHATGRPGRVVGAYETTVAGLPYIIAYALRERTGAEAF